MTNDVFGNRVMIDMPYMMDFYQNLDDLQRIPEIENYNQKKQNEIKKIKKNIGKVKKLSEKLNKKSEKLKKNRKS